MHRKKFLGVLSVIMALGLSGFSLKPVELLNDTPLIDLDKAIEQAQPGHQGNAGTEGTNGESPAQNDLIAEDALSISVRDTEITYQNMVFKNINALRIRLNRDCRKGDIISLTDDYAEAHVYKEVLELLKELQNTLGITYHFD